MPILSFATPRAFFDWLAGHHASSRGIWLRLAKKASGTVSITYAEAIDVALAWGWVDGQKQRFTDLRISKERIHRRQLRDKRAGRRR